MDVTLVMGAALVGLGGLQAVTAWQLRSLRRTLAERDERFAQREDRLAQVLGGLSLLTDTAETGFRDVALELARLASVGAPQARPASERRIRSAARKGKSVQEIAVAEQVSEGEVRLRLQLADARETSHASMR